MTVHVPHVVGESDSLDGILRAAQAGSRDAFARIYDRFGPAVHGVALAHVGPGEADDLTQEVFLSAFRGISQVRHAGALPTWLATLARNAAIDQLRRRGRRLERVPMPDLTANETDQDRELGVRLLALIQDLPSAYRETLVLRLVEGLTGPEIAEHTGMTHGSVRVNLSRGMSMLRPLLEREGWP